jgi:tRNA/rRNA methyltransferase
LYELVRDLKQARIAAADKAGKRATAAEMERISAVLLEALELSGYINPIAAAPTRERVRRMVRRLNLSSRDAELWLGMLRQMMWKIRGSNTQS